MSETVKVTLSKPIIVGEKEVSELVFREAEVGDYIVGEMAGKSGGDVARIAATLASMCDITLPAFRKIRGKDFARINEKVAPLMGNGEETEAGSA